MDGEGLFILFHTTNSFFFTIFVHEMNLNLVKSHQKVEYVTHKTLIGPVVAYESIIIKNKSISQNLFIYF